MFLLLMWSSCTDMFNLRQQIETYRSGLVPLVLWYRKLLSDLDFSIVMTQADNDNL